MIHVAVLGLAAAASMQETTADLPVSTTAVAESTLERKNEGGAIGVGTALTWRVTIDDPSLDGATLPDPELGVEWAVVDGPRDIIDGATPKSQRPDLVVEWSLLPLTGGTLTTPSLTATLGGEATVVVPASTVEVVPSLAETEEAPRPLLGFREAPDRRVGDPRAALLALLGILAVGIGLLLWRRSVKRKRSHIPAHAPELSAMEQLRGLDPGASAPGQTMASLAPIFRRAFDEGLPLSERTRRSSLTDDAWGDEVKAMTGDAGAEAARLLTELSGYRYGGGEPTSFAVKDALKRATELAAVGANGAPRGREAS